MYIQIEPLYFMLIVELSVLLLILAVFLFLRIKKYKKLYQKSLKDLEKAKGISTEQPTERESLLTAEKEDIVAPVKEEIQQDLQPEQDMQQMQEPEIHATQQSETLETAQWREESQVEEEGDTSSGKVKRLQHMVNFQKKAILDLMCYKDILESTQKRLVILQQTNNELQDKVRGLMESGMEKEGLSDSLNSLENNNNEIEKFIGLLDKENVRLSEKFSAWEDEFRRISEDLSESEELPVDEGRTTELSKEREELLVKVKEVEEKYNEKATQLSDMQKQYEDLEKEYMILYRQQQAAQQQQQG